MMGVRVTFRMREAGERTLAYGCGVASIYQAMYDARETNEEMCARIHGDDPIDGTGWAEAAFDRYQSSGNMKPKASPGDWNYAKAQGAGIPITEFESHRVRCGYVLKDGMWTKGCDGLVTDVMRGQSE